MRAEAPADYWNGVNLITDPTWGDNGKGKIVDYAAFSADQIIRFNGGDNAGHSVDTGLIKMVSHALPSGLLVPEREGRERPLNLIAGGAIINPINIVKEIDQFKANGIEVNSDVLLIHSGTHLTMPWHIMRDKLNEVARGGAKIGTTGRGIGPTYADKTNRDGFRVADLYDPDFEAKFKQEFEYQQRLVRLMAGEVLAGDIQIPTNYSDLQYEQLQQVLQELEQVLHDGSRSSEMNSQQILEQLYHSADIIKPMVQNILPIIKTSFQKGESQVGEAGQGGLLAKDNGNTPFTTSSNPTVNGFSDATMLPVKAIRNAVGVQKAYNTRVGSGPMPTEDFGELGNYLREKGFEYGATTGRPRRCGPLDMVALKWGAAVTGINKLGITKIDILDEMQKIKLCVAYDVGSTRYHEAPEGDAKFFAAASPVYIEMDGWNEPTTGAQSYEELPKNAQKYIQAIEDISGIPVDWIGVGPQRDATIYTGDRN